MAFIVGELVAPISTDLTGFNRGIDAARIKGEKVAAKIGASFKTMGANLRQVGTQMSLFLTLPLIGAAVTATKAGDDFDKALKIIRAGTGATGAELEALGEDFKAVAAEVPESFEVIARTLAAANTRAGQTGEGLRSLTQDILALARITSADPVRSVGLLTRLFGDWSISTDKQSAVLDKLLRAVQATDINLESLAGTVVQFGAPFRLLGFSLDESIALLSKWEKEGVNVETLLSGMRFALGSFARTGRNANQAFRETVERIKELGNTSEATALSFKTFGLRAANDMVAAILEGRFEVQGLIDTLNNGSDTVRQVDQETRSLGDKFGQLGNKAKLAAVPLGEEMVVALEKLLPLFESVVGLVERGVGTFVRMPKAMQAMTLGVGALLALAGPLLFIIGGVLQGLGSMLLVLPKIQAALYGVAGGMVALQAGLLTVASFIGYKFGQLIEPTVSELLGFNKLLAARSPHEDLVRNLAGDRAAFEEARLHLVRMRKSLGLAGDEWRVSSGHTAENARRVVELTEKVRALNRAKIQEAGAARDALDAAKQEAEAAAAASELTKEQREFIEKTIESLQQRNLELKLGADAYILHRLAQTGANAAELEQARRLLESGKALRDRNKAQADAKSVEERRLRTIEAVVKALEDEYDSTVASREAVVLAELATLGATEAERRYAEGLLNSIKHLEGRKAAEADAAAVKDRIRTATEREFDELEKLNELYRQGLLTLQEYGRAVREVEERYDELRESQKDTGEEVNAFARRAKDDLQNAFVAFFESTDDGFDEMVGSFKRALRRMLAELFASKLLQLFASLGGRLLGVGAGPVADPEGAVGAKAGGGLISGPGTGTSDSIRAVGPGGKTIKVSDGEYVIRAASVKRVGVGFLDAINALGAPVQAFMNGGLIAARAAYAGGGRVSRSPGGGGMEATFVYNVDARGASPGVERGIVTALRKTEDQAVRRAVSEVANSRLRGGNFARAFDK